MRLQYDFITSNDITCQNLCYGFFVFNLVLDISQNSFLILPFLKSEFYTYWCISHIIYDRKCMKLVVIPTFITENRVAFFKEKNWKVGLLNQICVIFPTQFPTLWRISGVNFDRKHRSFVGVLVFKV